MRARTAELQFILRGRDWRGTGLSDRSLGFGSLEERANDIDAVMRAAGSERAFLVGVSEGGPMAMLFAATNRERVAGLVLYGTGPRFSEADDWSFGVRADDADAYLDFVAGAWGTGKVFEQFLQHAPEPAAARATIARFERNACTPQMAREIMIRNLEIDVRAPAPTIGVPTVVIHATGDPIAPIEGGRYLAEHIPGASIVELDGDYHASWKRTDAMALRDAVADFVSRDGTPSVAVERELATVLFTDIVGSTAAASRLGDRAWRTLLDVHDRIAEQELERHRGRLVKNTGDGLLATFDAPSRAVACARAMMDELRVHDVDLRAGVHTGEIEVRSGDVRDVTGVGVVVASRICDLAGSGEVLVSRTVKDLVSGSNIQFADHGEYRLKGLDESWRIYGATRRT